MIRSMSSPRRSIDRRLQNVAEGRRATRPCVKRTSRRQAKADRGPTRRDRARSHLLSPGANVGRSYMSQAVSMPCTSFKAIDDAGVSCPLPRGPGCRHRGQAFQRSAAPGLSGAESRESLLIRPANIRDHAILESRAMTARILTRRRRSRVPRSARSASAGRARLPEVDTADDGFGALKHGAGRDATISSS